MDDEFILLVNKQVTVDCVVGVAELEIFRHVNKNVFHRLMRVW